MITRRVGLVLAALLAVAAAVPALQVAPDRPDGEIGLALAVAVVSSAIALATLALLPRAWRGSRSASLAIAVLQLCALLPSLPAFLLPDDVVPPGGVVLASLGALLGVTALALILLDFSPWLLHAAGVVVVVACYAGLVALATVLLPAGLARAAGSIAAVVVALAFAPIVRLLRATVGRSLYGARVDPAGTALRITRQAEPASSPLAGVLAEAARLMRLPSVELLQAGRTLESGSSVPAGPGARTCELPLEPGSDLALRVTLRPGERALHRSDRAALELVAAAAALLIRQTRLTEELRGARAAAARARDHEQLTLHRDLHDGLGPLLTGAALRADAARNLLERSDERAAEQLDLARADLRSAIAEIRRVVYGLRPLELEERGLWRTLSDRADRVCAQLTLPDPWPTLPVATEVAAYRILSEAISNIERHAPGSRSEIEVALDDGELRLRVRNDLETDPEHTDGVGLASLRARAQALGGAADAGPLHGGWQVSATLPLEWPHER